MHILPDVIEPGLKVVFCGTAAGNVSAKRHAYYAGPGNQFWSVLFRLDLTPRQLNSHEFHELTEYGIGLTDLAKKSAGVDKDITSSDFDISGFCSKIRKYQPRIVAFNGKKFASVFFGCSVDYGGPKRDAHIGKTSIFVLPSTSAAARKFWDESYWRELADYISENY